MTIDLNKWVSSEFSVYKAKQTVKAINMKSKPNLVNQVILSGVSVLCLS